MMHRRKTSKDDSEKNTVISDVQSPASPTKPIQIPFPQSPRVNDTPDSDDSSSRTRVNSVPTKVQPPPARRPPPSAGPYRTSFGSLSQSPPNAYAHPSSPFRSSFSHSRTISFGGGPYPYTNPLLSGSPSGAMPIRSKTMETTPLSPSFRISTSPSESSVLQNKPPSPTTRRHQRIHSRNLSVFFPRPGSLPTSSIAEDGSQEIEYNISLNDAPVQNIPSASPAIRLHNPPGPRRLGEGFQFGRTISMSSNGSSSDAASTTSGSTSRPTRRGHHHKHSLSHNFFSFLEPGAQLQSPQPTSPWSSSTPLPSSTSPAPSLSQNGHINAMAEIREPSIPKDRLAISIIQFILGASLWVSGQQIGSLGCTGLGYWVVFDAFGVALAHVVPAYLSFESLRSEVRRPYGNARLETVLFFAQSVYLIFSAVYICKETVEHLLLSVGDGHHHHPWDEAIDVSGIQFPLLLIIIAVISLTSTSLLYENHNKLLRTCGHRLPSISSLFRHIRATYSYIIPSTPIAIILSNPFTVTPLFFSFFILIGSMLIPASQHRQLDLLLASLETLLTFSIAYPAAVVQGTVLLQTSPPRGMPGGRMESFLRTMREIERHPIVLHLPAPHIWQLTPTSVVPVTASNGATSKDALVVNLELHVRQDADDNEVIELTRWAHDRCKLALGLGLKNKDSDDDSEVTIGVVRG